MIASLLLVPVLHMASGSSPQPANNSEWDLLYCAVTLIFVLAVVVGVATFFNRRDDRRA